jgi:hypothetical protein
MFQDGICRTFVALAFFASLSFPATVTEGSPQAATPTPGGSEWDDLLAADSLAAWVTDRGQPVGAAWVVKNGILHRAARGGSIFTAKAYADFELEFEWRISSGGNSGVKYRMQRAPDGRWLGPEYQILDDASHRDARNSNTSAAALYEIQEPNPNKVLKPAGEWNSARIVARGAVIEHWLNGAKVLEIDTTGPEWRRRFAKSKFTKAERAEEWFARKAGPVMIQDHGNEAWFRNMKIRTLGKSVERSQAAPR